MPDVLSVILRALSFVLLFQAAGVAIFVAIFGRWLASSQVSIRRLGQAAAIAGLVGYLVALVWLRATGTDPKSLRIPRLLAAVGIPDARRRMRQYPFELSGGMNQRIMIAIALICRPRLLIADEPTTALDVTIQAQILELMAELQDRSFMAIQLISHNLGVVSEIADDIIVMYAGRIVERAPAAALFAQPLHPYTIGLIETLPSIEHRVARLPVIAGSVPDPARLRAPGCRFAERCPRVIAACREAEPPLVELAPGHHAACIRAAA